MTAEMALDWFRSLLWTVMLASAPVILTMVVVGLIVAIIQAATQVNDQAVAFGPKAVAVVVALAVSGPWMLQTIRRFTFSAFEALSHVGH